MSSGRQGPRASMASHRSTLSIQKTEIVINVYDLLPPGRVSSVLWSLGTGLLHSGVVINGKEFAFGGHDQRGVTGVYWTQPKTVPPGGTFKCEILHGFTLATPTEIETIIRQTCNEFTGTSYNLLTKNCNHFTSSLCQKLTGNPGPSWLNRAAGIGVTFPCIVPRAWLDPPEYQTADGELVDGDDEHADEQSRMLNSTSAPAGDAFDLVDSDQESTKNSTQMKLLSGKWTKQAGLQDTSGRPIPLAEQVPGA